MLLLGQSLHTYATPQALNTPISANDRLGEQTDELLSSRASANIPTPHGTFELMAFAKTDADPMPNMVLVAKRTDFSKPVLVRLHSECLTGDLFHSLRCDCGEQLEEAMRLTGREGGVIIYLRQEGRGIGIINKLKAYQLQDRGADTIEANELLGLPVDNRDYMQATEVIKLLGIQEIRLLTNNPLKVQAFAKTGIEVVERVGLEIAKRPENERYLNTKRDEMGHTLK